MTSVITEDHTLPRYNITVGVQEQLFNLMGGDQINDLANQLLRPKDPEPILKHDVGPVTFSELDQWKKLLGFPDGLCATRKITKTCSLHGDKHYLGISYSRCNDRKICPRCAYLSARKTAYEMYEWLKHNVVSSLPFQIFMTQLVFTLPPDKQNLTDAELNKAVKKAMRNNLCKTAYAYVIQDVPNKNHRHVHVYAINVGLRKNFLGGNKFVKLSPFFNVDRLRKNWAKAIGLEDGKPVDVHTSYTRFQNKKKVVGQLSYMYRYPVWDVFKQMIRSSDGDGIGRTEGSSVILKNDSSSIPTKLLFPTGEDLKAFLKQTKKRVTWVGWLAPSKRYENIKVLGEPYLLDEIRQKINDDMDRCPYRDAYGNLCGARLKVLESPKYGFG